MNKLTGWIINNVKEIRSEGDLAASIPFTIWQRQWEVCDIVADRRSSEEISRRVNRLSEKIPIYQIDAWYYQCVIAKYQARYTKALELSRKGLEMAREKGDREKTALMHSLMGEACYNLSDYPKAIEHRLDALAIYQSLGMEVRSGDVKGDIGLAYWRMGDNQQALDYYQQALDIYQKNNDIRKMVSNKSNVAGALLRMDQADRAYDLYQEALVLARQVGDVHKQSTILNNLGAILIRKGRYNEALARLQEGLKIDQTIGNITGQASKMNNIGVLQGTLGNYDQSLEYLEKALEIDISTGNINGQISKLSNIADLWALKEDFKKAFDYSQRTVILSRQINSKAYLSHSLMRNVHLCVQMGVHQDAESYGLEGIALAEEIQSFSGLSMGLSNMADLYDALGQPDKALEYSNRAIEMIANHSTFEVALEKMYYRRYLILKKLGSQPEARESIERAYQEVLKKAREITDPKELERFYNNNKDNQTIIREWEELEAARKGQPADAGRSQ
ncbi:MAG: tetratricopeptide repeat protein [Candidatus Edwardsbacteria bacterium]|nr:tetratricopeptide repeat protein [Candidatus Edwardsbacteria bacterium]MBU1577349.1 tetratricopeptide repeat protein [Candidatus Edwardsbacteria bacterium]MBU2463106.1 tetratricopeptide repeat protein [Candidatus Edwardsbacteria bacterium]MBU2594182.1 tetratricopeptide repeat protein [Candidatus Edwardsbacteria bacterium]